MAAYRLYTVVPALLRFIDQLTNWYVRLNRARLKGEENDEDAASGPRSSSASAASPPQSMLASLSTLYHVILTLARVMAPFTPFIVETMFRSLAQYLPADLATADSRSIHFLPFPEPETSLLSPTVEGAVGRLQTVVDLARALRERHALPLKTPIGSIIVLHSDTQFLDDVKSLLPYLLAELNVRKAVFESNEADYGIVYKAQADFARLGRKLRGDLPKVKAALPLVPSPTVRAAMHPEATLSVCGFELAHDEFSVVRSFDPAESQNPSLFEGHNYVWNASNQLSVLIDTFLSSDLADEGCAREIINRVQRLRKKSGLVATDPVNYFYHITSDPENRLASVIESQKAVLDRALKIPLTAMPTPLSAAKTDGSADDCSVKTDSLANQPDLFVVEIQNVGESYFELGFERAL